MKKIIVAFLLIICLVFLCGCKELYVNLFGGYTNMHKIKEKINLDITFKIELPDTVYSSDTNLNIKLYITNNADTSITILNPCNYATLIPVVCKDGKPYSLRSISNTSNELYRLYGNIVIDKKKTFFTFWNKKVKNILGFKEHSTGYYTLHLAYIPIENAKIVEDSVRFFWINY